MFIICNLSDDSLIVSVAASYLPFGSDPVASTSAMGMPGPSNADGGAMAGPGAGAYEPAAPWLDNPGGMTLAAELLGVPSVSNGFTAKVPTPLLLRL